MPVINRTGDVSEQKEWASWTSSSSIGTGATIPYIGPIPFPYQVQSIQAFAIGMSGAPQLAFSIFRSFPNNGGNTVIAIGISNMVLTNGITSLPSSYSGLVAQNSTLLIGKAWDTLLFTTSGANSAATQLVVNCVIKKTQDIVSHNGISS